MIELIDAGKYYPTKQGPHYVFRHVSLVIPSDINVGIIGRNGAGKSTLLRLLGGVDIPSEGRIIRTGRISWPIGQTPSVVQSLTGAENARFACRIYGMDSEETREAIERMRELADIGKHFDLPVSTYSKGMKARVAFAISMAMEFDYYLFDEVGTGGDKEFKKIASAMVEKRLQKSRFIMVTHHLGDLMDLCQAVIIMGDGQLRYFDDVREAIHEYGEEDFLEQRDLLQKRIVAKQARFGMAAQQATAESEMLPEPSAAEVPPAAVPGPASLPEPTVTAPVGASDIDAGSLREQRKAFKSRRKEQSQTDASDADTAEAGGKVRNPRLAEVPEEIRQARKALRKQRRASAGSAQ